MLHRQGSVFGGEDLFQSPFSSLVLFLFFFVFFPLWLLLAITRRSTLIWMQDLISSFFAEDATMPGAVVGAFGMLSKSNCDHEVLRLLTYTGSVNPLSLPFI